MRKINFKGKRVDGKGWVFGSIVTGFWVKSKDNSGVCEIISSNDFTGDCWEDIVDDYIHEVIPETVCQFTGLTDKNGVEIYEGDELKIQLPMGGFWGNVKTEKTGLVKYESDYGGFIVEWEYSKHQHHELLTCDIAFNAEITGSIHDK